MYRKQLIFSKDKSGVFCRRRFPVTDDLFFYRDARAAKFPAQTGHIAEEHGAPHALAKPGLHIGGIVVDEETGGRVERILPEERLIDLMLRLDRKSVV